MLYNMPGPFFGHDNEIRRAASVCRRHVWPLLSRSTGRSSFVHRAQAWQAFLTTRASSWTRTTAVRVQHPGTPPLQPVLLPAAA